MVNVGDDGKIADVIHGGQKPVMQGLSRDHSLELRGMQAVRGRMKNKGTRGCLQSESTVNFSPIPGQLRATAKRQTGSGCPSVVIEVVVADFYARLRLAKQQYRH
jgi:hypothetical protein